MESERKKSLTPAQKKLAVEQAKGYAAGIAGAGSGECPFPIVRGEVSDLRAAWIKGWNKGYFFRVRSIKRKFNLQ